MSRFTLRYVYDMSTSERISEVLKEIQTGMCVLLLLSEHLYSAQSQKVYNALHALSVCSKDKFKRTLEDIQGKRVCVCCNAIKKFYC